MTGEATHKSAQWSVRWRAFADAVAIALGLNVWVSVVLLPGIFVGAWNSVTAIVAATVPIAALIAGLWRRSDALLLLGFPSALLMPAALYPEIIQGHVYDPARLAIVAAGLIAYIFGVAFLSKSHDPPIPKRMRALASSQRPPPPRWQRRFRVYRGLALLSVAFPATLVYGVNYTAVDAAQMRALYPDRVEPLKALLNLGVLALWVGLFTWVFLGILRPHRVGDPDLILRLAMLRAEVRGGRPRTSFYVGVAATLTFMLLLLLFRYR